MSILSSKSDRLSTRHCRAVCPSIHVHYHAILDQAMTRFHCCMGFSYESINVSRWNIWFELSDEDFYFPVNQTNSIEIMPRYCVSLIVSDYHIMSRYNAPHRKTSYISRTLVGNKIVDNSDVVEHRLSALLQLHLHSQLNTWLQWIGKRPLQEETRIFLCCGIWCD